MAQVGRLFHGIVVMGTALGCGGRSEHIGPGSPTGQGGMPSGTAGSGTSSGGTSLAGAGTGGGLPAAGAGGTTAAGAGGITAEPIVAEPEDCAYPAQFDCVDPDRWTNCVLGDPDPCRRDAARLNCYCDPTAPRTAADCANTQQFTCWPGYYDQYAVGCFCDPNAPIAPTDCPATQEYHCRDVAPESGCACDLAAPLEATDCTGSTKFTCRTYDPPTDCECVSTIILPK